jgi:hypothetical protein
MDEFRFLVSRCGINQAIHRIVFDEKLPCVRLKHRSEVGFRVSACLVKKCGHEFINFLKTQLSGCRADAANLTLGTGPRVAEGGVGHPTRYVFERKRLGLGASEWVE